MKLPISFICPTQSHGSPFLCIPCFLSVFSCSFAHAPPSLLTWCDWPHPPANPLSGSRAQRRPGRPDVTSGVNRVSWMCHKEPQWWEGREARQRMCSSLKMLTSSLQATLVATFPHMTVVFAVITTNVSYYYLTWTGFSFKLLTFASVVSHWRLMMCWLIVSLVIMMLTCVIALLVICHRLPGTEADAAHFKVCNKLVSLFKGMKSPTNNLLQGAKVIQQQLVFYGHKTRRQTPGQKSPLLPLSSHRSLEFHQQSITMLW